MLFVITHKSTTMGSLDLPLEAFSITGLPLPASPKLGRPCFCISYAWSSIHLHLLHLIFFVSEFPTLNYVCN